MVWKGDSRVAILPRSSEIRTPDHRLTARRFHCDFHTSINVPLKIVFVGKNGQVVENLKSLFFLKRNIGKDQFLGAFIIYGGGGL